MIIYIIAIILMVALAITICVIAEQKMIIDHQGKKLIEALDWIEPDKIVRGDCNGDCTNCLYSEVDP